MNDSCSSMNQFPSDFADLLTPLGRRIVQGKDPEFKSLFASSEARFLLLTGLIDREKARACIRLLDRHIYRFLSVASSRIEADSIAGMKQDHGEVLEKVFRLKTAFLSKKSARSYVAADKVGLLRTLRSESFGRFAEMVTGLQLAKPPSLQIFCYEHGDYVGPHNDHYPEQDPDGRGYIDVHVMLSNSAVSHQYLIYEKGGHFSQVVDVNLESGISIYRLPFWHQVTPLIGKPGRENEARRWLLLGTFDFSPVSRSSSRSERP